MNKNELENLVAEGLTTRGIAEATGKAQTTVRYWLKKHGLRTTGRVLLKFSDAEVTEAVVHSKSFSEVCRKLGASYAGSSHQHFTKRIQNLGLDTTHFSRFYGRVTTKLCLTPDIEYRVRASTLRSALNEIGRSYRCEVCQIHEWQGKPIRLHVDHIDGNWKNNCTSNLRYLCLNCHSQTPTYCLKTKRAL